MTLPRSRSLALALFGTIMTGLGAGCSIKAAGSVAQPTALELQLLGAYRKLDDELVQAGSIRAAGPLGRAAVDALAARAIDARAMQRFNQDDIDELKAAGCLAEGRDARLQARPCALVDGTPDIAKRRARVIRQENAARRVLLDWAAVTLSRRAGEPAVSAEARRQVQAAYVRLLRQAAAPGHLVEVAPGRFEPVPAP